MEDRLDEIFESRNLNGIGQKGLTSSEAKAAILQAFIEELPMLKLAEYTVDGKRCVVDESIGWNRAIEAVKKRLGGGE